MCFTVPCRSCIFYGNKHMAPGKCSLQPAGMRHQAMRCHRCQAQVSLQGVPSIHSITASSIATCLFYQFSRRYFLMYNLNHGSLQTNAWGMGEEKRRMSNSVTSKILSLGMLLPLYFVPSYFSHLLRVFCKTKPSKSPSTKAQTVFFDAFHSYGHQWSLKKKNSWHEFSWCSKIYMRSYLRLLFLRILKHINFL